MVSPSHRLHQHQPHLLPFKDCLQRGANGVDVVGLDAEAEFGAFLGECIDTEHGDLSSIDVGMEEILGSKATASVVEMLLFTVSLTFSENTHTTGRHAPRRQA